MMPSLRDFPARATAGVEAQMHGDGESMETMVVQSALTEPGAALAHGALGVLADAALGQAVRSLTGDDDRVVTTHLHLAFLRPLDPGDERYVARCSAALAPDRHSGSAWGEVSTSAGVVVARANLASALGVGPTETAATACTPPAASPRRNSGPVDILVGRQVISVGVEGAEATFNADPLFLNGAGAVHGGFGFLFGERLFESVVATIDSARRLADLRAVFLRPIPADGGTVRAVATTIHRGRRLVALHGTIEDQRGRPAVVVDATYFSPVVT